MMTILVYDLIIGGMFLFLLFISFLIVLVALMLDNLTQIFQKILTYLEEKISISIAIDLVLFVVFVAILITIFSR